MFLKQTAMTGQAKASGVPAVSPIPNLHLLAGRNVGHSAQVSPTRNKCTPSMSEKSDVALLSSLCVRCSRGPMDKAKEEIAGSSPASSI